MRNILLRTPLVGWIVGGVMLSALGGCSRPLAQNENETEQMDFRKIILRAKEEVFPALIFVKPIVEEFISGEKKQQEVFGSGVLISPDGYAVTNFHVVDKAVRINCVLYDERQVEVELVGSDRDTDLADLKIKN